ncbi:hypothetical protein B5C34_00675 [Pacificimonas flava]|uniref:DUF1570 domain-containing protein n=2 Tax=Pacificimonas TaxID=1960290 RepID=A0A219B1B3_9SPHN|nr:MULTISPECIES: hypothetical protein [Pacificimonas]MBZ6378274.1 hypothetical protein [Pacificimonas aurantium]OWV32110.1 hypothetical protein B5C34_00675 [Pacificimonas flava]
MFRSIVSAALLLMTTSPAAAEWVMAESEQFRVYSRGSEQRVSERAQQLEQFDQLLRIYTGVPSERSVPKLDVWLLNNSGEMRRTSGMDNVAGLYVSSPGGVCAFAQRKDSGFYGATLLHEYTHHFMSQHFAAAYPKWFVEGFAEYFMTAEFDGQEVSIGRYTKPRGRSLLHETWLPSEMVLSGVYHPVQTGIFYAMSWLLTHYVYADPDRTQTFQLYLNAVAGGSDPVTAWEEAFGQTPEELDVALDQYMDRNRINYRTIEFEEGTFRRSWIRITEYPNSSDDMLPRFALLDCTIGDSEEHLEIIRDDAEDHDDPYAQTTRAYAEAIAGETSFAIPALTALARAEPDNADHHYYLGRAYSRRAHEEGADMDADHERARVEYARAYKIRPDHVPTLYFYAHDGDAYRGENERNMMLLARELRPQISQVSTTLAVSYAIAGEWEMAEKVLAPVANNPHLSDDSWARELMQRIHDRDTSLSGEAVEGREDDREAGDGGDGENRDERAEEATAG